MALRKNIEKVSVLKIITKNTSTLLYPRSYEEFVFLDLISNVLYGQGSARHQLCITGNKYSSEASAELCRCHASTAPPLLLLTFQTQDGRRSQASLRIAKESMSGIPPVESQTTATWSTPQERHLNLKHQTCRAN